MFPAETATGHIVDPRKSWARVMKRSGIEDLRPHDLRRSLGSWQAIAGASLPIIGASLGHKDPKATAVYARLQLDPVRRSVDEAVDSMVKAGGLLGGDPRGDQHDRRIECVWKSIGTFLIGSIPNRAMARADGSAQPLSRFLRRPLR